MMDLGGRTMQIKKEEIRVTILETAQEEFLIHGYEGASMRVIAKKANTTIGNIYHYYDSKDAILEEMLKEPIEGLHKLVKQHFEREQRVYTLEEIEEAFTQMEDVFKVMEETELQYMMDKRLLILFDLKTTRFLKVKEYFIGQFKEHMAWHLGLDDSDSPYVDIITEMFIACIRHVLLQHQDSIEAQKEFIKVFRMLCAGLVVNQEDKP